MKKYLYNEKGITLVEVLAVLVIGTIILLLISNIHLFSQKQYKSQSEKTRHLYDVTYATKVITKEIRKANASTIEISDDGHSIKLNNQTEYKLNGDDKSIVIKSVNPTTEILFVAGIKNFEIRKESSKLIIEIESVSYEKNKTEKIKTEIILR